MNEIGLAIKQLRFLQNISTYDLAKKTGIAQSTISKLENGKRNADIEILKRISTALNTNVENIINGPKPFREIVLEKLYSNDIDYYEIRSKYKMGTKAIRNALVSWDDFCPDDFTSLSKEAGFSKNFCKKMVHIEETYHNLFKHPDTISKLSILFDKWANKKHESLAVEELLAAYNTNITDVKEAMDVILAQPGLMLNGEPLSDESKIALANAINMGLAYAAQKQQEEKDKKNK